MANHGRLLVDCADYYKALHQAILCAKHSIFILGWEIDSGVRLLRGEDEKASPYPSVVVDLLNWKARENPEIQIYLLRWDSSLAFVYERELLPEFAWTSKTPENLHICLDSTIPIGGSQHQKIVVIDDELAFSGGMDLARQRWDQRSHAVNEPERTDELGPYGPYHDVQVMVDGPVVTHFSELVRWRWERAAGSSAHAPREIQDGQRLASCWPSRFPHTLFHIRSAIARTIPKMSDTEPRHEVCEMIFSLIQEAKKFIYIENQFLACNRIANLLNQQMKKNPQLKVMCVSSYNPQGILEREGLWAGRIEFKERLGRGLGSDRYRIFCTGIERKDGDTLHKRIHSKVMVIDDRFLVVGSANINNRSMTLDTECDVIFEASSPAHSAWIQQTRNDLIAEHSGLAPERVAQLCDKLSSLDRFMSLSQQERYSLRNTDDTVFTTGTFQKIGRKFADPDEPLLQGSEPIRNPSRTKILAGVAIFALILVGLLVSRYVFHDVTSAGVKKFLEMSRASFWALPAVIAVYVIGGFFLFPVTLLSLITAAVFGPIWGPIYGMSGALSSATAGFYAGQWAGYGGLRKIMGERIRKIDKHFQKTGIIGIMLVRLLPIAPFTLVNLAAGVSSVGFLNFIIATFLAFLPAFVAKGILGDSLTQVLLNPNRESMIYLGWGIAIWSALVTVTYFGVRRWQKGRTA